MVGRYYLKYLRVRWLNEIEIERETRRALRQGSRFFCFCSVLRSFSEFEFEELVSKKFFSSHILYLILNILFPSLVFFYSYVEDCVSLELRISYFCSSKTSILYFSNSNINLRYFQYFL